MLTIRPYGEIRQDAYLVRTGQQFRYIGPRILVEFGSLGEFR